MKPILISIIIPVYNVEKYLSRCLDSVLSQRYVHFELLLIDDGSTDHSGAICDMYSKKDDRVTAFHKTNGGPSSARNVGLKNAKGDFVCFIDSDDYVEKAYLSSFIDVIDAETDLVVAGYQCILHSGDEIKCSLVEEIAWVNDSASLILPLKEKRMFGFLWNKMYRRELFSQYNIDFDNTLSFMEDDYLLLLYFSYVRVVKLIPDCCYHYFEPDWGNKYPDIQRTLISLNKSYVRSETLYPALPEVSKSYLEFATLLLIKYAYNSDFRIFHYFYAHFKDAIHYDPRYGKKINLLFIAIHNKPERVAFVLLKCYSYFNSLLKKILRRK